MTDHTITIAPVKKTVRVNASQAKAFDVFTAGIDRWWPKNHGIGAAPLVKSAVEPRAGGRWYSVHEDGSEVTVGHVLVWEPSVRVAFSWEINAGWKSEPDRMLASEVDVRFFAEGPSITRVELVHHRFEAMSEGGEAMRNQVDGGWPGILDLYRAAVEA